MVKTCILYVYNARVKEIQTMPISNGKYRLAATTEFI